MECAKHAQMVLSAGGSFAIPLRSLCVVTDPDEIGRLRRELGVEKHEKTLETKGCATYEAGYTLDL